MKYKVERVYKGKVFYKKETNSLFNVFELINKNHSGMGDLKGVKYIITVLEDEGVK